ncbi:hypothetical protein [Flavobacterium seoulense]|uniref:Uncharacterized protein n=1 Tax=Flavobacterium seoulense TaxID=1492738 RepID=A0A066WKU5_9FLAO|nr:hypothetical protein [Flavobacterium seoulense]KDN54637.1 hypothetical protein FEM21_23600 [Flavobacterium seoulense]
MKNIALILGVLFISFGAFAQDENNVKQSDLKGPAFKNFKHWMHKAVPTKVYSEANKTSLQGPAYKNAQPWKETSKQELVEVKIGSESQKLTGPAYKNHGPWSKKG